MEKVLKAEYSNINIQLFASPFGCEEKRHKFGKINLYSFIFFSSIAVTTSQFNKMVNI